MDKTQAISQSKKSMTFVLVAGEVSGDLLGGELIKALRDKYPYARFVGIGGSEMIAQGLESWYPMEMLSVMGIVAVLKRLPSLLELRANVVRRIIQEQPAAFIGIDAPDFNLGVAKRVHEARVKTVQYVSPTVWAWRQGRVFSIAKSVDLMLTLFPFEREFYLRHGVKSAFVGHPAADEIPLLPVQQKYQDIVQGRVDQLYTETDAAKLLINSNSSIQLKDHQTLAVLPGSRGSEIEYILPVFLKTMKWLVKQRKNILFVVACANERRRLQIEDVIAKTPGADKLPMVLLEGGSRTIMGACDAVLLASGTATLEAMLMKKPMVVAFKWHWLTHFIISRLVKSKYIALPNILANQPLVPELIQRNATSAKIGPAVLDALEGRHRTALIAEFARMHKTLAGGASVKAAAAIAELLSESLSSN
ncbi:MAG TPA: lipid-A-disaccharide synthase [Gammaproteobacteria bacterium]|mgnify:CR=1 FL=1|nr:lipid-A-disaccharide synthase [Gammaproteobacteria bacterium]MEC8012014.1 lipid-A-disaccharide synthase [Pseudomonadota bacterium]HBF09823.1 lipid-A-disaccharide synthase [Gammaproteobacteria bacterium]HCK92438.1 lipid-A-disaccharide synthase [Gammaproteobacteria bacterium]|tara:strand:- start:11180 stop:12439 length:1260 start_codon:yes stop_codon:yes gene_type:complete